MLAGIEFCETFLSYSLKFIAVHTSLTIQKLISSKFEITGFRACYIWFVNMK
jgi:hypothetical protein